MRCVPLLVAYGKAEHDGHGGVRYVMTDDAFGAIESVVGHSAKLERLRGAYVVLSTTDNAVVTIGHRFRGRA